jgi:PAS domain S-box-containing protein
MMDYFQSENDKNINSILAIIKLGVLLFSALIISFEGLVKHIPNAPLQASQILEVTYKVFVPILLVIYLLWSYIFVRPHNNVLSKRLLIFENFIFIALFTTLILLSGSYASQFKFLFLFVIISSVMQLGAIFGTITSLVSSTVILAIDLMYAPNTVIKDYFQNDLVLAGSLILAAWTLGRYAELQKQNIDKKDEQLYLLNIRLTEEEIQRKHIENLILKSEACYDLLINNSNNAIFVHRYNKLIFSNRSAAELLGTGLDNLMNKPILELVPDSEKEAIDEKYNSIFESYGSTTSFEQKLIGSNGNDIVVKNTSISFIYEGQPTILTILHDITSEKQVEVLQLDVQKNIKLLNETRELNKLITEFFSNISHELKTPLNIIFSAVQLLSVQNLNNFGDNKNKYLKIMKQNCYRLMRLINNLLDLTRTDSGFLVPHMKNYNIIELVEDITMSVAEFAESKGISLIFDTDCEEKITAVDPDKLERIILNLLSNALKFTNSGGEIFVNIADKVDFITISVKDSGIGIPEDKLQFIFERFRQVDRSFTRNHEGSGIGLSLVKSFVEMHNGNIEVNSEIGQGSEFVITLPIVLCNEDSLDEKYIDTDIIERINLEFSDIYS